MCNFLISEREGGAVFLDFSCLKNADFLLMDNFVFSRWNQVRRPIGFSRIKQEDRHVFMNREVA
jgi:hypothetical protein